METSNNPEIEIVQIAAIIEDQLRSGFLNEIAATKVEQFPESITPLEVADIILPQPKGGEVLEPRWTLVEKTVAATASKAAIAANSEAILSTVEQVGLRRLSNGERLEEDLHKIDPEKAIFLVEGGANKTSIVRRGVAISAMHELYGQDLSRETLFQFGSDRDIYPTRDITKPDGTKETIANAEHKIIRDLAGDYFSEDIEFTEFYANFATALAEGYINDNTVNQTHNETITRVIEMSHTDTRMPRLVLIQPSENGLVGGLDAMRSQSEGSQFVIATNGQYREKDVQQAELWKKTNSIDMLPTVAIGDEPGDKFPFKDGEIEVPNRPEAAYVNEFPILYRSSMELLPDYNQ